MTGQLFTIVGPSGVGKDTILDAALQSCGNVQKIKRVITRPTQAGGEDYTGISKAEFDALEDAGAFAFTWHAHGLFYGIPKKILDILADGQSVVFNGSRSTLAEIHTQFPSLIVLSITADVQTLRQRLLDRGREDGPEIERRLARADLPLPAGLNVIEIDNSGLLEVAVSQLCVAFTEAKETVL